MTRPTLLSSPLSGRGDSWSHRRPRALNTTSPSPFRSTVSVVAVAAAAGGGVDVAAVVDGGVATFVAIVDNATVAVAAFGTINYCCHCCCYFCWWWW